MSSSQRAADLRALADQHDAIGALEDAHATAVDAYRTNPTPDTKQAYTDASEALREARAGMRGGEAMAVSAEPGSVTIGASAISGKAG